MCSNVKHLTAFLPLILNTYISHTFFVQHIAAYPNPVHCVHAHTYWKWIGLARPSNSTKSHVSLPGSVTDIHIWFWFNCINCCPSLHCVGSASHCSVVLAEDIIEGDAHIDLCHTHVLIWLSSAWPGRSAQNSRDLHFHPNRAPHKRVCP